MRYVYWLFWIVLFALMVLFAVYNLDQTQVHLFSHGATFTLPLFVLLAISFILGLLVSVLGNMLASIKHRRQYSQLKSEYKKLEKERDRLREADVAHRMAQTQTAPAVTGSQTPATTAGSSSAR